MECSWRCSALPVGKLPLSQISLQPSHLINCQCTKWSLARCAQMGELGKSQLRYLLDLAKGYAVHIMHLPICIICLQQIQLSVEVTSIINLSSKENSDVIGPFFDKIQQKNTTNPTSERRTQHNLNLCHRFPFFNPLLWLECSPHFSSSVNSRYLQSSVPHWLRPNNCYQIFDGAYCVQLVPKYITKVKVRVIHNPLFPDWVRWAMLPAVLTSVAWVTNHNYKRELRNLPNKSSIDGLLKTVNTGY